MSSHRFWGGGSFFRRPALIVPAALVVLIAAAGIVWWIGGSSGKSACGQGDGACAAAETRPGLTSTPPVSPGEASAAPTPQNPISSRSLGAPASTSKATHASETGQGPCSSAKVCAFPHAGNTGPRTKATAARSGNQSIRTSGTVISGWNLTGSLDIYANNVTVTNCTIKSSNWWAVNLRPGYTGLKVTHCRISDTPGKGPDNGGSNYAVSNMGAGTIEVGFNDISGFGNVLSMGHGSIHDNYVHDLAAFVTQSGEWQHTDGVISDGDDKGGLVIKHNTVLNQTPINKGATAAVGLFADDGPVENTTVQNNWLAGGAYVLYGGSKGATNVKILDNVFSTQFHPKGGIYGFATAFDRSGSGNEWSNNRTSEGAVVQPPSL
jgi:hypothetical protein